MKIWKLECNVNDYENFQWEKLDLTYLRSFNGESKLKEWTDPGIKRMYGRELSNFPGLTSHIPVVDTLSYKCLLKELKDGSELLPIVVDNMDYCMVNVTEVLDCINYDMSEYKLFSDGKRIMRFENYVFHKEVISGKHIFKIKDEPLGSPFVSDEFKEKVLANNLTGFDFKLAWSDEEKIKKLKRPRNRINVDEYNMYILVDKISLEDIKLALRNYEELYSGVATKHEISYELNYKNSNQVLLKLERGIRFYDSSNLISWLNQFTHEINVTLIGKHINDIKSDFVLFAEKSNPSGDTLFGTFKDEEKFIVYLPKAYEEKNMCSVDNKRYVSSIRDIFYRLNMSFDDTYDLELQNKFYFVTYA